MWTVEWWQSEEQKKSGQPNIHICKSEAEAIEYAEKLVQTGISIKRIAAPSGDTAWTEEQLKERPNQISN